MAKALMFLSFLSLVILAIGAAFFSNAQLFMLASINTNYQIIREVLASVLFLQLITHPPRHFAFRVLAGLVAVTIGGWAIMSTYNGTMNLLDTFSLIASATAIGVTALEVSTASEKKRPARSTNPLIA